MYDLIGDIHGHAEALVRLLETLGYRRENGSFRHAERQAIFLGDFIDRGPRIREVLEIARPMVEAGHALAVMGNHELNALAYHTPDPAAPDEYLRRHTPANRKQHGATLDQLPEAELRSHLEWFRTLPLWLDLEGLRVVHACWDPRALETVAAHLPADGRIGDAFLRSACLEGGELFVPVEVLLKGKEGKLPDGAAFADADGHPRSQIRTRWYLPPHGHTYRSYAFYSHEIDCDLELDPAIVRAAAEYPVGEKPVFFGHYWLSAPRPEILAPNVACLDYSVAKGGFLCAYRWEGESTLRDEEFVRV